MRGKKISQGECGHGVAASVSCLLSHYSLTHVHSSLNTLFYYRKCCCLSRVGNAAARHFLQLPAAAACVSQWCYRRNLSARSSTHNYLFCHVSMLFNRLLCLAS